MNTQKIFDVINDYAPLSLSKTFVEKFNAYDNSGVLVDNGNEITGILTCLDLTKNSVDEAIKNNCNLIITHHPAIYKPILSLNEDSSLLYAVNNGINVISFHLNLDCAKYGIDYYLAKGLGGKEQEIIYEFDKGVGYGRKFTLNKKLKDIVNDFKKEFNSEKLFVYGDLDKDINKVASFCGSGLGVEEINMLSDVNLFVSSDIPHHVLLEGLSKGKCVMQITHYASEIYGFSKFYEFIKEKIKNLKIQLYIEREYM